MVSNELCDDAMINEVTEGISRLSHVTNFLLLMGDYINSTEMYTQIGNLKLGGIQLYNMTWYVTLKITELATNNEVPVSHFKPFMLTRHHLSAHITPPRFPALSFPVGVCTISHFGSGSLIVTGGSNENIVLYSIIKYLSLIEDLNDEHGNQRFKITSVRLSPINYVQSLILPFKINLSRLTGWTYNPRKYPAAINNQIIPGASVTIFDSGAVNICGKILIDIEENIIDTLVRLCQQHNAIITSDNPDQNNSTRLFKQILKVVHTNNKDNNNRAKRKKI